jgi:small redox-active disulfide protein 2
MSGSACGTSSSGSVVRGNRPLRMLAIFIATLVVVAHFLGQINLLSDWIFWIVLFMTANAIQASFSGFCPMFKNPRGECIACGVACDKPAETKKDGACCTNDQACCSDTSAAGCCEPKKTGCCDETSSKQGCCDASKPNATELNTTTKADHYHILVLGTGCANCTNTYQQVEKVTAELGLNVTLEKVEDIAEISKYGIMATPGVVINDQVVHSGGVPSAKMIKTWF